MTGAAATCPGSVADPTGAEVPEVLAVDLDGTLLRSNMLHETFWSAFSRDWRLPFAAAMHLRQGRAALKRMLVSRSDVNVAALPYDDEVLEYVRDWRARGGKAILVTATDQHLAELIADHLGVFDEAVGSDGLRNLKGRHKADYLVQRFGKGGYAYVGDTHADIPVWRDCGLAVVRSRSRRLRTSAARAQPSHHFLASAGAGIKPLLATLRPHQWLKNLLVFLAVAGAHRFDAEALVRATLAFVSFSLIASSVYVVNDLLDLSADRAHPRKRNRPFASGNANLEHGLPITAGLLIAGTAVAATLGPSFVFVMAIYCVLTTAYSLALKRNTIIDICTLAALYTIRILAGGVATGIPLSMWLLVFSLFFFFSLAAVKRQAELVDAVAAGKLAIHGRGYHPDDLPLVAQMATASGYVSVMVMALYVNSEAVSRLYAHPKALWGITLVLLYWISRMIFTAHRGQMHDDPVVFAAKDKVSIACGMLIVGFALVGSIR